MVPIKYKDKIFTNYLIDEDGNIWSKKHKKFLTSYPNKDGYLQVRLFQNKIGEIRSIASLVMYTFNGEPPIDMEEPTIDHIDGNRINNNKNNLRWLPKKINTSQRIYKANSGGKGENNIKAKLTDKQVKEICVLLGEKQLSYSQIANIYNISKSQVAAICQRRNWTHISKNYQLRDKNSYEIKEDFGNDYCL